MMEAVLHWLQQGVWVWLAVVNAAAFLMFGIDKARAKRGARRIPEKTLLLSAVVGGSVGAIVGMRVFHHKTRHKKFYIGLPVIFVLQTLLIFVISY